MGFYQLLKRDTSCIYSILFHLSLEPPLMSAFYSPVASLYLEAHDSANIEIHFLPFNIGERQCSIIFLNETIGEFLYSIEATATLPLPSEVPFVRTPHSVRITSAAAAGLKIFIFLFEFQQFCQSLLTGLTCSRRAILFTWLNFAHLKGNIILDGSWKVT